MLLNEGAILLLVLEMDTVKPKSTATAGLVNSFAKALRLKVAVAKAAKFTEIVEDSVSRPSDEEVDEKAEARKREKEAREAFLAELFAGVSAIKAAYAQLQAAQSPYDPGNIQLADGAIVSELKTISQLKQSYFKKQMSKTLPESTQTQLQAESQELKNLLRTYEIMAKKLQSQLQLKESELVFLREKLQESASQTRLLEKRLDPKGSVLAFDNLHFSALNPGHFVTAARHASRAVRSFAKLLLVEMETAGWDLDAAAQAIQPDSPVSKPTHRIFAVESFVSLTIFANFHQPAFSDCAGKKPRQRSRFFEEFMKMKSANAALFLAGHPPESEFAEFVRVKYLALVHPRLESSLLGDLRCRTAIRAGGLPDCPLPGFLTGFLEMAKRVWALNQLAFAFKPEAAIFQVRSESRFSEVYMESACDDPPESVQTRVGFTVSPGFMVGKTVAQARVYLVDGPELSDQG